MFQDIILQAFGTDNPKTVLHALGLFLAGLQLIILYFCCSNLCNLEFTVRTGRNNYKSDMMNGSAGFCQTRSELFVEVCETKGGRCGNPEAAVRNCCDCVTL